MIIYFFEINSFTRFGKIICLNKFSYKIDETITIEIIE
jgi:hypothetical protein